MVIDQLAELRFETTMEEMDGILVIEVAKMALILHEQGNILSNGLFLL